MHIRKAKPQDAQALLDYLRTVGGESDNLTFGSEGLPISPEAEAEYLAALENAPKSVMLVAEDNVQIVGNIGLQGIPRQRLCHRGDLAISVRKSHWGQGVGSRLMEAALDFARNAGLEIVSLEVRSDNLRAIRLYEKFGFRKIGEFPGFLKIQGEYADCILMHLSLK